MSFCSFSELTSGLVASAKGETAKREAAVVNFIVNSQVNAHNWRKKILSEGIWQLKYWPVNCLTHKFLHLCNSKVDSRHLPRKSRYRGGVVKLLETSPFIKRRSESNWEGR